MAVSSGTSRLSSDFRLGGLQAEADPLLERAFYESGHYRAAERRDDPRCFVIGRTGSGKSAILRHLESSYPEHVIRIEPENLALQYITDLGVVKYLSSIDVNLDVLFTALWRHVFLVEVIRHRYNVDSAAAKQNFMLSLTDRIKKDHSKELALDYLDDFEGKFWCETDERVRDVTTRFEQQIDAAAKAEFGAASAASLSASLGSGSALSTETRAAQVSRFQRVVNETQLARLSKMITVLDEDILDSPQNFVYIIIDDLDREWVDERVANTLVRCLFRAVRDLKKVRHLKIVVALRTNIFQELGLGHHSGEQEEKFRDWIIRMRWTPADIVGILDERARIVSDQFGMVNVSGVKNLLPIPNKNRGNPVRFILDRTLMRPRDAIDYINECLSLASGKSRISWDELVRAERPYSRGRLSALSDEWSGTYPGIAQIFECFRGAPVPMSRTELTERLDDIVTLEPGSGMQWIADLAESVLDRMGGREWADTYEPALRLLFSLGFLGFSQSRLLSATYLNDDPDFANHIGNLQMSESFLIHPAFRAGLDTHDVTATQRRRDPF